MYDSFELHKTHKTNREVDNSSVDNDNFELTHGGRKDLPSSGLNGFVFFLYNIKA